MHVDFWKIAKLILQIILRISEKFGELPKRCPIRKVRLFFTQQFKSKCILLLQKLYYVNYYILYYENWLRVFSSNLTRKNGMMSFMILTKEGNIFKEHVNGSHGSVLFKIEKLYKNKWNDCWSF